MSSEQCHNWQIEGDESCDCFSQLRREMNEILRGVLTHTGEISGERLTYIDLILYDVYAPVAAKLFFEEGTETDADVDACVDD